MALTNINEKLTIHKEDSILAKLCKFCAWFSIVVCFLIFGLVWLVLFFSLGGLIVIYKCFELPIKHHINKKKGIN